MDSCSIPDARWQQVVDRLSVWQRRGERPRPYKALLLLLLLGRAQRRAERTLPFAEVEQRLAQLMEAFGPPMSSKPNPLYPYWYLQKEGCWTVPRWEQMHPRLGKDGGEGSLSASEPKVTSLRDHGVGEVPVEYWMPLLEERGLLEAIARPLLERFWADADHAAILAAVDLRLDAHPAIPGAGSLDEQARSSVFGFVLAKHLQDFIVANWDRLPFVAEWSIYANRDGAREGVEFRCGVGRIDILARHRRDRTRWLVVELKRGRSSEQVARQLSRYMGWVSSKLAEPGDRVEGMVIAQRADLGMRSALSMVPHASLMLYELDFQVRVDGWSTE